ncbi:MAG TPA: CPBP family intramembrane glutamic endopeptidase [Dongiaceae bacterium]|nr:CPBP family intramembrane glutamic endopeptidase [Dongiaceae bacterium]
MLRIFLLALECTFLFLGLPLLIKYRLIPNFPIPYLVATGVVIFFLLRHDGSFDSSRLFAWGNYRPFLRGILVRDVICLALLGLAVRLFAPELLFSLIKQRPWLWALIMVLYPLLSVYPQELLYRAFFFHRYQPLFGSGWTLLLACGLAFGFVHIIFGNWLSVVLCIVGGFLFSYTYQQSGSLLLTCLDHSIFGNFIFTIGLGQFFYHGTRR